MFEKTLGFARDGKGRRLYNALSKKNVELTPAQIEQVLAVYKSQGIAAEVASLKKRRGILTDAQYDAMARKVADHCCAKTLDDFLACLKDLLSSGMKMNPTKMEDEDPG